MKSIIIEQTTGADTRSATSVPIKAVLLSESHLHRSHVRKMLAAVAAEVIERAELHDHTKISDIDGFYDAFTRTMRKEIEFKEHHWWRLHLTEKHHINDRLHDDADLLDLIEMIADCVCAGMARTGKVFPIEIPNEVLQKLLSNTAKLFVGSITPQGR